MVDILNWQCGLLPEDLGQGGTALRGAKASSCRSLEVHQVGSTEAAIRVLNQRPLDVSHRIEIFGADGEEGQLESVSGRSYVNSRL